MSNFLLEGPGGVPQVKLGGRLATNKPVVFGSTLSVTGAATLSGGVGQSSSVQSTVFHSGGVQPVGALTTNYHQTQFSSTTTYYCEVFIPASATLTGIAVLNGGTTSGSQNLFVGLANASGAVVASSNTTTAQSAANAYQQIPFTSTYNAPGPGKYFILIQGSATTGYLSTHSIGNFSVSSKTNETYGTFTSGYATTTFTANVGPVADTY